MVVRDETVFAHTPYDGSRQPFTIGLAPLDLKDWIEPDHHFEAHLAEKERLFENAVAPVFLAEADTVPAQGEVLGLLLEHLPRRFPDVYSVSGGAVTLLASGRRYEFADFGGRPLLLAAKLVQEDLVIMRKGEGGYRLVAAALAFPSSWSLAEKFGRSMPEIHEGVPGFNDGRMGPVVARIFDNLAVDRPVWRLNWSLYSDPELHHPMPKQIDLRVTDTSLPGLHVRVERQTLRRLPGSGNILFTIKIHHDPVAAFAAHPEGARLALGLRRQLLELTPEQLAYKALCHARARIAEDLLRLAESCGKSSKQELAAAK
ncbi:DUF3445 domain-containing protein [Stappia sp. F7233]|uniref:DUF3445 domain-containing protein n=1 Tax=Stappia albiluteola TaxID=2758565 RepID=A0A839ACS5_9HYPH|nr:DUF3445 domain-containing protein [Stappia albiluteola]MBA5777311.1 DUF3445 domain-containing protein [Stappia albiluteola]